MKFPNLFIIGAMKSATSSLHEYLGRHPQIFMSEFKEPQFFSPHRTPEGFLWGQGHPHPEPGDGWYRALFARAGGAKYAGESSTSYTRRPVNEGVAGRIAAFNPEARLVYVMRDPVERALSHYRYHVASLREGRPLLGALRDDPQYVDHGRYRFQLEPYMERFPREQIYLMTFEELKKSPADATQSLLRWLGVDADIDLGPFPKSNATISTGRALRPGFHGLQQLLRHYRVRTVLRRLPSGLDRFVERAATRPIGDGRAFERDLPEARAYLVGRLAADVGRLREISGLSLAEWENFPYRAAESETAASDSLSAAGIVSAGAK